MDQEVINSFLKKSEERKERIERIKNALSSTAFQEKAAEIDLGNGKKEISSIFDGNKVIYRASSDDKNVFYFTNPKLMQSYLER
jgi:hypothetical protein